MTRFLIFNDSAHEPIDAQSKKQKNEFGILSSRQKQKRNRIETQAWHEASSGREVIGPGLQNKRKVAG